MDLGPKTWATPAPIFKWGICIVGILLMMFGILSLWDLESTGAILVRGMGRISAGNTIWPIASCWPSFWPSPPE